MSKIDWHAGFVPAMKLEFIENENDLVFEEEHPVDKRGNWIDLLIIKNSGNVRLKNKIGAIFNRFNIVEYKSPNDTVTLGAFYKALAYTGLYLKEIHQYERYGSREFTMTIVCYGRPIKLMKQLARDGIICTETEVSGIYRISGCIPFRAQIIVTSRLPDEYVWLKLLTDKATKARVKSLITGTEALQDPIHKEYADRIANTFVSANSDYINKLNEEEPNMCEAVELLFAEKHKQEMAEMNAKLSEKDAQISKKDEQISKKDEQISHLKETIAKLQSQIAMM